MRLRTAERSALVRERCPLLAEALPLIGHVGIRNRGTIGGSLAHADPAAELPAVMVAVDAGLVARSTRGERTISAHDFYVMPFTTSLQPDELLVGITIRALPALGGYSFQEVSRRHGDFAMAAVAALIFLEASGVVSDVRLAFAGVGPTAFRAREAEYELIGGCPTDDALVSAAHKPAATLEPTSDIHGTAAYRRHLAEVLALRALKIATSRAARSKDGN